MKLPLIYAALLGALLLAQPAASQRRSILPGQGGVLAPSAGSQAGGAPGNVRFEQKISALAGGFDEPLAFRNFFGWSVTSMGDRDGDGVVDVAVGTPGEEFSGMRNAGAVWILHLNADGSVKSRQKIASQEGGFPVALNQFTFFGRSVAHLGDLDGDGIGDLAVGATGSFVVDPGVVYVLFLKADGTVREHAVIGNESEALAGLLGHSFGWSVDAPGDMDGDGVVDLVVSNPLRDDRGVVWLLHLRSDGSVKSYGRIGHGEGGFTGTLDPGDNFGSSLASLGDLDGDCVPDLAVGARGDDGRFAGVFELGAMYVLLMRSDGTVKRHTKIGTMPGMRLTGFDYFGGSASSLGDLDGDGNSELAVGSIRNGSVGGIVWVLFMAADGSVRFVRSIGRGRGGFMAPLEDDDQFGTGICPLGDLDGDGVIDIAVGQPYDDDGELLAGALWILSLDGRVLLDFDREDDRRTPLVDGQEITGTSAFGRVVEIDGFPGSGLTAALYDSCPQGPNRVGQGRDDDLLVGRGNVLMLQENKQQSTPGIYDHPDDDARGGLLRIDFRGREVKPRWIDLIDICAAPGQGAFVTLVDHSGRNRIFTVPAGWTEDVAMDGPPGWRRLNLTMLKNQPGYLASASAVQDEGFDPTGVVTMWIHLLSSGAVDTLVFDPHP